MKFTNFLTKTIATVAVGALLLSTAASATTVNKVPNMGLIPAQYSAMVIAANNFDTAMGSSISALLVNSFTGVCYSTAALDAAISNATNAKTAISNISFLDWANGTAFTSPGVRDNGNALVASTYLAGASLPGAITISLDKTNADTTTGVPSSEYYKTLTLNCSLPLYSAVAGIKLVDKTVVDQTGSYNVPYLYKNSDNTTTSGVSKATTVLDKYIALLTAVKAFDLSAGCYDGTAVVPPANATQAPATQAPAKVKKATKDAIITASDQTIAKGSAFSFMKGVTATDNNGKGKDITNKVTVSGKVNTAVAGAYKLTYSVKGANGKTVTQVVTITVK